MVLQFLLPARCAGCRMPCIQDLCGLCARSLAAAEPIVTGPREGSPPLVALGSYEGVLRSMVLSLKFRGARRLGNRIGRRLAQLIPWHCDAIVSVPLHAQRLRERGYNQAEEIALGVAAVLPVPLVRGAIMRRRATRAQSTLDLSERTANVADAFAPGPRAAQLAGRLVLIVDDVVTTGSTVRACADVLRSAGIGASYVAAAAVRR